MTFYEKKRAGKINKSYLERKRHGTIHVLVIPDMLHYWTFLYSRSVLKRELICRDEFITINMKSFFIFIFFWCLHFTLISSEWFKHKSLICLLSEIRRQGPKCLFSKWRRGILSEDCLISISAFLVLFQKKQIV